MLHIDGNSLTITDVVQVAKLNKKVRLKESSRAKIKKSRDFVEKICGRGRGQTGIIVGFLSNGKCRVRQVDGVTWNAQSPSNFRLKTIWGHK